jgi:acyl-CoA reductase-like NAD-dependent aldehyde dehydrogenase
MAKKLATTRLSETSMLPPQTLRAARHLATTAMRRRALSTTIAVDDPYTGETYCEAELFDEAEVMRRADVAKAAQRQWRATPLAERIAVCGRMIEAMHADADRISSDISGMMGKPVHNARGEIGGMEERARAMMELAEEALADEILPEKENFARRIVKEPVGTVLVIAPWNFPLLTAVNTVVPAVLAGNAVLIKQSERTPLCADHFVDAFLSAGAPEGLVQSANCAHDVSAALIASRKVDYVAFTGSVAGGRQVYSEVGATTFCDATLELGGKDAAYVAEDADVAAAAAGLVDGAMFNAGQSCCGIERIYVHRSLYETFLDAARTEIDALVIGDPKDLSTSVGPMAQPMAPNLLLAQVEDAQRKGARVLTGGAPCTDASGKGRFFPPTLLADCDHTMECMKEESFGPLVAVCPVDDEDDAIAKMNDSPYGLTAAVFSSNSETAERMAPQLDVGTVFMNRCDYLDPLLPWSGQKDTGKGCSLSRHGFNGVTRLKGYHFKMDPTA